MEDALFVKLSDTQRKELINYYTSKLVELESQANEYRDLLRQLSANSQVVQSTPPLNYAAAAQTPQATHAYSVFPETSLPQAREYKVNWPWSMKIKYAIMSSGRCLTSREVIDKLQELEPNLQDPMSSVSGSISSKISKGVIFNRYRPYEGADHYIGLKEWFDEEGELIDEKYRGLE